MKKILIKIWSLKPKFFLVLGLTFFGIFAVLKPSYANLFTDLLQSGLIWIIYLTVGWLAQLISYLIGSLLIVITAVLIKIVQYNNFIYVDVVVTGWAIVRDVCNMFFVVILVVIAIGTILRIETYNFKRALPKLLLMIILINFSKLISGIIIDAAQVVTLTFAQAISDTVAGNLYYKLGIAKLYKINQFSGNEFQSDTPNILYVVVSMVFGMVMLVIAFFVILVYTLVFFFRIIALWLLVILSPLAYFLASFPQGEQYSRQWWQTFTRYVIAGPVLMFFFWLALTLGSTTLNLKDLRSEGKEVDLEFTKKGVLQQGGDITAEAQQVSVAYSEAGTFENVVQFIVVVLFLIGGLIATQRLNVAGAGFAGAVVDRARRMGTAAALAPLKGAGAFAMFGVREGLAAAGLPTLTMIKLGWEAGKLKRLERRETKRQAIAGKRLEKGGLVRGLAGSFATPEHFFQHVWNWRTISSRQGWSTLRGGKFKKLHEDIKRKQERLRTIEEEESTWQDPVEEGRKAIRNRIVKEEMRKAQSEAHTARAAGNKENDFKQEYDDKGKLKETEYNDAAKKEGIDMALDTKPYYDHNTGRVSQERIDAILDPDEKAKVQKKVNFLAAWDKPFFDEMKKQGIDASTDVSRYYVDGEVKEDEIEKITNEAEKRKVYDKAMFLQTWDATRAGRVLDRDRIIENRTSEQLGRKSEAELAEEGSRVIEERINQDYHQSQLMRQGYLNKGVEEVGRDKLIKDKQNQLVRTEKNIRLEETKPYHLQNRELLASLNNLKATVDRDLKALAKKDVTVKNLDGKEVMVQAYEMTEDDKQKYTKTKEQQANRQSSAEKLEKRAQAVKVQLEYPGGPPETLRIKLEQEKKDLVESIEQDKVEAERVKPFVDYSSRRSQRVAIRKEMQDMTTDNWQELLTIYKDAVREKDTIRAAAAYIKATQDANENEFQNALGYNSDANGLRQIIEKEFIDKLGMDKELAMSIGNDISYAGEHINHWGVARAVRINKVGQQEWQTGIQEPEKEHQRLTEVLAEVRKQDFENYMRRANRLAYGFEEVPGATTEEKMKNFSAGGAVNERAFHLNDFGKTFILENFDKFQALLDRGRFNINLALNLTQDHNLKELERLVDLTDEPKDFMMMLTTLKHFAHGGRDPYERYNQVYARSAGR